MNTGLVASAVLSVGVVALAAYGWRLRARVARHERESARRMYEVRMLKEIDDRTGYSLDVRHIADVIIGSLSELVPYRVAAYALVEPERVRFSAHIEGAVSRAFLDTVRARTLASLDALSGGAISRRPTDEMLAGAALRDDAESSVGSFFNIPLVVEGAAVGVLTVADATLGRYGEDNVGILYAIVSQAARSLSTLRAVVAGEERKLNALVETIPDGVAMIDAEYRVTVANRAARAFAGTEDTPTLFDIVRALGSAFDIRAGLDDCLARNAPPAARRVSAGERVFDIALAPVAAARSGKDEVLGAVAVFHDVSREVAAERLRDEFTSMLVHELRSPLSGIRHIAEVLDAVRRKRGVAAYREYLALVRADASRMLALINDILDIAKLEAGKFSVSVAPADLRALVAERVEFFKAEADAKGIELAAVVAKKTPPAVALDASRTRQVFDNLLSNALKFSGDGATVAAFALPHTAGGSLEKELSDAGVLLPFPAGTAAFATLPAGVVAGVADTGPGVPDERQAALFSKFTQLEVVSPPNAERGTGLGLAITKGIVEAHGGSIHLASVEGAGSVFYFVLPLKSNV